MTDPSNEFCRIVLEALPTGVYVANREGKVTLWSAGAEKLTGYLRQDILGRLSERGARFLSRAPCRDCQLHQGLASYYRRGVRPPRYSWTSPPHFSGIRKLHQRQRRHAASRRVTHACPSAHHHQEKGQPWWSPRRSVEGRLRRLCHCHDGSVHRSLAHEQQQAD